MIRLITPPGLIALRRYQLSALPGDIVAGILVAALAIPQALGYSVVADVPVQVGLYTLPPALLAYALFGSSRLLFVGPVSTISVLSGSLVRQLSDGDQQLAVQLTATIAVVAGLVLLGAGLLRLGWVARFLSRPIVTGFVTGLVVLIVVGEIPGLLGLDPPTGALTTRLLALALHLPEAHGLTAAIGAVTLLMLFAGSALAPRVPWALLCLVAGIVGATVFDWAGGGVRVVGAIPSGLPVPSLPLIDPSLWADLLTGGLAVAGVGIAEGLAAARTFSTKAVQDDNELIGNGLADIAAGLFGGMAVAGSLSKTAANARAGAKTQLSGVAATIVVLAVLLFATGLLTNLPKVVLSAVVIHAVWGLVHPSEFRRFAVVRRNDFVGAIVALVGVLLLGPLNGLLAAIAQSLLGLIYRSMQVGIDEMGRVKGEKAAWGAITHDESRRIVHGVCVLRPDGPLFWANANSVIDRMEAYLTTRDEISVLVIDLEATNQMDTTSAERLSQLIVDLKDRGITVMLVRVFESVGVVLERAGVTALLGPEHVWHSISAAVKAGKLLVGDPVLPEDDVAEGEEQIAPRSSKKKSA